MHPPAPNPIPCRPGGAVLPIDWLPADQLPQPFRRLLVRDNDMTSALADFHADTISLTVHYAHRAGDNYFREVTLHAATTGAPVEYGLIEIHLDAFPPHLLPLILAGTTPLGAILNDSGLPYRSAPQGFFRVPAAALADFFPAAPATATLYGRHNHLLHQNHSILARILEILPPLPQAPNSNLQTPNSNL